MKKVGIIISSIIIVILIIVGVVISNDNRELKTIKSEKELLRIYENKSDEVPFIVKALTLPFSLSLAERNYPVYNEWGAIKGETNNNYDATDEVQTGSRDYSKTNIQVEGVDEADIIKTDGKYIYSISENKVIITSAEDPKNIKVVTKIDDGQTIPTDLLLYKDKLVVILTEVSSSTDRSRYYWYSSRQRNTMVNIYNIENKEKPKLEKSFKLNEEYNTSRCIDGKLYIFSNGYLRKKDDKVDRRYLENDVVKNIDLKNIKYLSKNKTNTQTLIAEVNLNKVKENIKVSSYLIDMAEAYVSKENVYILHDTYDDNDAPPLKAIFGLKGVFGLIDYVNLDFSYQTKTKIYKFNIKDEGLKYQATNEVKGTIINQYSLDEKDNNLRIALHTNEGSNVTVLNKNLKQIGKTENVAEGEEMYASRFMGDKAYLVTYKNTDPLFVIDLKDPTNPKVLGELKIPGYSTYLHPYDENHLIGIGMETKEVVNKGYDGRIISTWTRTVGMKMSLFDVSDVNNPVQVDSTVIGDSRTVSAILTNPKALLFSKEKELVAIPVNRYPSDFMVESTDEYEEDVENFTKNTDYVGEGYLVYKVNLEGFKLKGQITHEKDNDNKNYWYYDTKLLRGLYIDDNLYTVSEKTIKVNKLSDLKEIKSIDLKGEE